MDFPRVFGTTSNPTVLIWAIQLSKNPVRVCRPFSSQGHEVAENCWTALSSQDTKEGDVGKGGRASTPYPHGPVACGQQDTGPRGSAGRLSNVCERTDPGPGGRLDSRPDINPLRPIPGVFFFLSSFPSGKGSITSSRCAGHRGCGGTAAVNRTAAGRSRRASAVESRGRRRRRTSRRQKKSSRRQRRTVRRQSRASRRKRRSVRPQRPVSRRCRRASGRQRRTVRPNAISGSLTFLRRQAQDPAINGWLNLPRLLRRLLSHPRHGTELDGFQRLQARFALPAGQLFEGPGSGAAGDGEVEVEEGADLAGFVR